MDWNQASLLDPILTHLQQIPDQTALIFWAEDGKIEEISYRQFYDLIQSHAAALQQLGIGRQDGVILVLQHSLALVATFWGALYLGARPAIFPYYSPTSDPLTFRQQIHGLVTQSGARAVVTFTKFEADLRNLLADSGCQVLGIETIPAGTPQTVAPAYSSGEEIAFLQYTSGTTGAKKGVMLSHRAVLNSIFSMVDYVKLNEKEVIINWLPLYHDYGLIAGTLFPLVTGRPTVLISPFRWVRRPAILFEAIHRYQGTICYTPNFAFNHSVNTIRDRDIAGYSLSSIRLMISGAEPVRHESQQNFVNRFQAYGFNPDALVAGYGMAENTLAATITPIGKRNHTDWVDLRQLTETGRVISLPPHSPGTFPIVSCGRPIINTFLRIVDEQGNDLPERQVGDVWLKSQCLFSGYHLRPELTAKQFQDGWYDTGDVGYMADGQLYICDRKQDLIIVGGRNIYPKDLEAIAMSLPEIKEGGVVALGLYNQRLGTEGIILICELTHKASPEEAKEIEQKLRQQIANLMGIVLQKVHFVNKGWIIKTQNAKLAREANRQKYETQLSIL